MLLCRANVTDSDLTLDKFKDLFFHINHIQNNHTYFFLIRSFSPSCWFLLYISDQSFIFLLGNTSSKSRWKLEEPFLLGVNPLSFLLLILHSRWLYQVHICSCFSFAKRTQICYFSVIFFLPAVPLVIEYPEL